MKFILCIALLFSSHICLARKTQQQDHPASYAIWNVDTGHLLVSKDSDTVRPMASITKLMTVLVTLKQNLDLNEQVLVQGEVEHSAKIRKGALVSRRELIDLTLVASDNLAARTLSETSGMTYSEFIDKMNATARSLGMNDTHYEDSTGLLGANVSTTSDLKRLVTETENHSEYRTAAMKPTTTIDVWFKNRLKQISANNTNAFAGQLELIGAKTGFTNAAGRCLTMFFVDHGQRYILVVLGAKSPEQRRKMVTKLIDTIK